MDKFKHMCTATLRLKRRPQLFAHGAMLQVVADVRTEQRAVKQQQVERHEVARCMERILTQLAAKERAIDYEVRVVSSTPLVQDAVNAWRSCHPVERPCMVL